MEGLEDPSKTEYHDLVFLPKNKVGEDNWGRKPGYFYYQRQNQQKTVINAERITQKEDHYEVLTDVSPHAKEIPSLMESQKPKREHRSWLTLDNMFNGLDTDTVVGEPTPDSHEYEIEPERVHFKICTIGIEGQKYCRISRENGNVIPISPNRWSYNEQTRRYTFMVEAQDKVAIPTWQEF